ncbi:putative chloroplast envelope membrane protein, CemA [Helianthus annuus]|uniref:Chloroplast envelope membrane protein, CemA n=1 Tax=Helianthus annuus TaxID=4232 RepID=A0A251V501_HELAN|nr:chloroplast envelope membrane protein [Helianthus annuus]KAF5813394.1 putative chloroplast envelope membrane protein, CemA [Helianthus annuus]
MVYMFLMSSSMVLCYNNLLFSDRIFACRKPLCLDSVIRLSGRGRRGFGRLVPNAKKKHTRKRTWWQKFFFDEDGNWLGLKDDEMLEVEEEAAKSGSDDEGLSENEKFEAWRRRAEALVELKEAQENVQNEEERKWEDWLLDATNGGSGGGGNSNGNGSSWFQEPSDESVEGDSSDLIPGKGFTESVRDLVFGREDDEILYEDRVFRYASFNSAKFLAALIIIPWALDFFVHDYVLMPFLDRYVKTVPLAAEILDVRKHQKLEMVKELKTEKERYKFEVEIGKSPPISDEELYLELRHKALELRDEWRLINRSAFANIWSDMVFGISLFVLLYFNQNQVALLKFTGYKIINNISDTGKAFLIILITDIFLGYHSESGWQTLLEIIVDHYGFDVDHSAIIIFVCLIPVVIDACVKLWMFKFLPRLSPKVSNIFQEMKRH